MGGEHMEAVLIAAATSADIFAAVMGLRAAGIKMPLGAYAAAALSGSLILLITSVAAMALGTIVQLEWAVYASKALLFALGAYTASEAFRSTGKKEKRGGIFSGADIIGSPEQADSDNSKTLSLYEAAAMGLALSSDSALTGISAGAAGISPLRIFFCSALFGIIACLLGNIAGGFLGKKLKGKLPASFIAGAVLILLAFLIK